MKRYDGYAQLFKTLCIVRRNAAIETKMESVSGEFTRLTRELGENQASLLRDSEERLAGKLSLLAEGLETLVRRNAAIETKMESVSGEFTRLTRELSGEVRGLRAALQAGEARSSALLGSLADDLRVVNRQGAVLGERLNEFRPSAIYARMVARWARPSGKD